MGFFKTLAAGVCTAGEVIIDPIRIPDFGIMIAESSRMSLTDDDTHNTHARNVAHVEQAPKVVHAEQSTIEYERQLKSQADDFLNHKQNVDAKRAEYEVLLDEYEEYITALEGCQDGKRRAQEAENTYKSLRALIHK